MSYVWLTIMCRTVVLVRFSPDSFMDKSDLRVNLKADNELSVLILDFYELDLVI